jgi:hypothetical protein
MKTLFQSPDYFISVTWFFFQVLEEYVLEISSLKRPPVVWSERMVFRLVFIMLAVYFLPLYDE